MIKIYFPLMFAGAIVLLGMACYHMIKYEINEDSKLFRYRPSRNNILIKLKLFKYDWKFNYLLLIPYLISWGVFFVIIVSYIVYWSGCKRLEKIFTLKGIHLTMFCLIILYELYIAIIQIIINKFNGKAKNYTKEEKELAKKILKDQIKKKK